MIKQGKKLTGRKQRMQHFKELHGSSGLNVVSLMDIFTILVFFLLVNTSAQQLPSSKDMKLPTTVATKVPEETLVIAVTRDSVLVGGRRVAGVSEVLASSEPIIGQLLDELKFQSGRSLGDGKEAQQARAVTIMSDETIPYALMNKVLTTCRQARYTNIAFAAYQQAKGKG
ncbi:MAG: hypothetical protein CVV05_02490 [Gammaproteobacteria bacterium HGW-Gammaproteobacteria-1]|jgi:biopolymer transport protein ExbD|nr:MAG: hypothetical protein CVV05_02490 [Gammaproteobacteria bacterium HGW-Gammaproteobacteria-1]